MHLLQRTHLRIVAERPEWYAAAACRGMDPNRWHPSSRNARDDSRLARSAKAICATCPVQQDCLEHALTNNETFGIWGGKSERERARIRRQRNRGSAA